MTEEITIIIERGDGDRWISSIPEIPGAVSQGRTPAEAREMVLDCMRELMAARREEALKEKHDGAQVESIRLAS